MKQVIISALVVLVAAGILAGMVLYSVSLMRSVELEILTGERLPITQGQCVFGIHTTQD